MEDEQRAQPPLRHGTRGRRTGSSSSRSLAGAPPCGACAPGERMRPSQQKTLNMDTTIAPCIWAPAAAAAKSGSSNMCNQCHLHCGARAPGQCARVPAPCGGGGAFGPRGEWPLGRGTRVLGGASSGLWVKLQGRSVSREILFIGGRPLQLHGSCRIQHSGSPALQIWLSVCSAGEALHATEVPTLSAVCR